MRFSQALVVPVALFSSLILLGSGEPGATGDSSSGAQSVGGTQSAIGAQGASGGSSDTSGAPPAAPEVAPEAAIKARAEALPDFSHDTGLLPASSPIQVQMIFSAGGGITVDAVATHKEGMVVARPSSGKLSLDVHVKLAGKLKVDSMLAKYDGVLPGLKNIDIPIGGETAFNPFLLAEGQSAEVTVKVPETKLPSIPLGAIPGSLLLTVSSGSTLSVNYHGTCVAVASGMVRSLGVATTSGKLILKGQIVPSLPKPLNKPIDVKQFEVLVPATISKLESAPVALTGAYGQTLGPCP